jgi:hypothetical protein
MYEYQDLRRSATRASRWHTATMLVGIVCLVVVGNEGLAQSWWWLIGAIFAIWTNLWALIDLRHFEQAMTEVTHRRPS